MRRWAAKRRATAKPAEQPSLPAAADDGCSQRGEDGQGRKRSDRVSHERTSPAPVGRRRRLFAETRRRRHGFAPGTTIGALPFDHDSAASTSLAPHGLRAPPAGARRCGGDRCAQTRDRDRPLRGIGRDRRGSARRVVSAGLSLDKDIWVVADDAGALVAYALCWLEAPPDEAAAEQLVDPACRGMGLNELLLGLCEARAAESHPRPRTTRASHSRSGRTSATPAVRAARTTRLPAAARVPPSRTRSRRQLRGAGVARRGQGRRVPRRRG